MAPEQWRRDRQVLGPWTDLYALGCVAWQLVTRESPFDGVTAQSLRLQHASRPPGPFRPAFEVPVSFDAWLRALLQKRPADRLQTAAEAAHLLRALSASPGAVVAMPQPASHGTFAWDVGGTFGDTPSSVVPFPTQWARPGGFVPVGLGLFGLRALPLVDRDGVRDRLWRSLGAVLSSRRSEVVVLRGPTGMGKSALCDWLCARAEEVGAAAALRATHRSPPTARDGLVPMLERFLRLGGLDLAAVRAALDARFGEDGDRVLSLLRPDEVGALPADARTPVVVGALRALAEQRPLVVWLDDVHLAPDALGLLRAAMGAPFPALVVATAPAEVADAAADVLERVPTLQIDALAPADTIRFLRQVLGLEVGLAVRVAEEVAGNPLAAVSVVSGWVQRGDLVDGPAGRTVEGAFDLPSDRWSHRVERVLRGHPEGDRKALLVAALLGVDVSRDEWVPACRACGTEPGPLLAERLEDARLVSGTDDGFRFVHGEVPAAIVDAARTTADWAPIRGAVVGFLLGVARALRAADRHAAASLVFARGAAWAETDDEHLDLEVPWVDVLRTEGRLTHALVVADGAIVRAARVGRAVDEAIVRAHRANALYEAGRFAEARAGWEDAIVRHTALGRTRSVLLNRRNLAVLARVEGRFDEAIASLETLRTDYAAAGDAGNVCRVDALLGRTLTERAQRVDGRSAGPARESLERAIAGLRAGGSIADEVQCVSDLATLLDEAEGDTARALALLEAAVERLRALGTDRLVTNLAIDRARIAAHAGRATEAVEQLTTLARSLGGDVLVLLRLRLVLAEAQSHLGQWEAALEAARQGLAEAERLSLRTEDVDLLGPVAIALAGLGRHDEVAPLLDRAAASAATLGWPIAAAEVEATRAVCLLRAGALPAASVARSRAVAQAKAAHALPHSTVGRLLRRLRTVRSLRG